MSPEMLGSTVSQAVMIPSIITASGAVLVGVIALVGVIVSGARSRKSMLAAEDRRHDNSVRAERLRRYDAARDDLYVRLAGLLVRLSDVVNSIEMAAHTSAGSSRRRLDPLKEQTLTSILDEFDEELGAAFLYASKDVYGELRDAREMAYRVWDTALVMGAIVTAEEHEAEAEKTGAAAQTCLAAASGLRARMRDELRHGETPAAVPSTTSKEE